MNLGLEVCPNFNLEILKMLKGVAEEEGLISYDIKKTGGTKKGDGYFGIIAYVEISGSCATGKKTLNLVVKTAFTSSKLRQILPIAEIFQREIYMYTTVLPEFHQLLVEKRVPNTLDFAKCYKTNVNVKNEALILENLETKGFKLWERRIPMDKNHVVLVLTNFGRFHALSFGLKHQKPQLYEKLIENFDDNFFKLFEKSDLTQMLVDQCNKAANTLTAAEDGKTLNCFSEFIDKVPEFILNLPKLVDNYSVILHGDPWTNNILFEYNDQSNPKSPSNMRFIDFQMARLAPPVLDISYFFYACSSKAVIDNVQHYLDIYYNSLSDNLRELGCDPDQLYPYSVFMDQWKQFAKFGLLLSTIVIRGMLKEEDEVKELTQAAESGSNVGQVFGHDIAKSDEWNERLKHMILHFVKNEFI